MSEIKLFHGDCMLAMRDMQDKTFDLAIVDPPYGIGKFTCDAHTDDKGNRIKRRLQRHERKNERGHRGFFSEWGINRPAQQQPLRRVRAPLEYVALRNSPSH